MIFFATDEDGMLTSYLEHTSIDMPVNQFVRNFLNLVLRTEIESVTYHI